MGIHVHDFAGPCAVSTYERFTSRRQKHIVWISFPIEEGDSISILGIRTSPAGLNILIWAPRVGDIIIGPHARGPARDRCLGESTPISLTYVEPGQRGAVPYFSAHCKPSIGLCKPFPLRTSGNPLSNDAYFSWAPLEHVSSTFYDLAGFCRGIILYYENGGSRSVGECRVQVDSAKRIIDPHWLCFRAQLHPARRKNLNQPRNPSRF